MLLMILISSKFEGNGKSNNSVVECIASLGA